MITYSFHICFPAEQYYAASFILEIECELFKGPFTTTRITAVFEIYNN